MVCILTPLCCLTVQTVHNPEDITIWLPLRRYEISYFYSTYHLTFGGAGNGDYRGELKRAIRVITSYPTAHQLPVGQLLVRLDGLYGNAAPLRDVLAADLGLIGRSRDYRLLDLVVVQKRLTLPPDQECTHPESGVARALYDCAEVPLAPGGPRLRLIVATHPATSSPPSIGVQREGMVYELFVATLPCLAFTPSDVLDLYLHRGSFETVLADEDREHFDHWSGRLLATCLQLPSPTHYQCIETLAILRRMASVSMHW